MGDDSGVMVKETGTCGLESEVEGEELQVIEEEVRAVGVLLVNPVFGKN